MLLGLEAGKQGVRCMEPRGKAFLHYVNAIVERIDLILKTAVGTVDAVLLHLDQATDRIAELAEAG